MNKQEEKHLSKFLSLILRHQPETIGIELDAYGWALVDEIIKNSKQKGINLDIKKINYIVENCPKKRYEFNSGNSKIRANQGHSVKVDLELKPVRPPVILFHGTAEKNLESILQNGINKRNRNHVHLSSDIETAVKVGARHGKVIVLNIDSDKMFNDGIQFYISNNHVWLTDFVDIKYISINKSRSVS